MDIFLTSAWKHILWVLTRSAKVTKVLLMSTHNIGFRAEIRKMATLYPSDLGIGYGAWTYE